MTPQEKEWVEVSVYNIRKHICNGLENDYFLTKYGWEYTELDKEIIDAKGFYKFMWLDYLKKNHIVLERDR